MFGAQKRKTAPPAKTQNPNTLFQEHVVNKLDAPNLLVSEYDVVHKQKPTPFCMRDLNIPQWLLITLVTITVVVFTAFAIFTAVVTLKKGSNGDACKSNSDCREDLGLICNNYRCGCAYSHFWSNSYTICERRHMINRTCANDSQCDALGNLQCTNVTLNSGGVQLQCQCQAGMNWNGYACAFQGYYNASCVTTANCDTTRYLYCNTAIGNCRCNSTMFWNSYSYSNSIATSGTCEYKRTVNQYCYPYDNTWCDNTGPLGQLLTCAAYVNPYGSEYGVCQCSTYYFYNVNACIPLYLYNVSCTSTSQCDYRTGLSCLNNLCLCPSGTNYNPAVSVSGGTGFCSPAATYLQNCTTILQCSVSESLYCDYAFYGGANTSGICLCNTSWSYWDGIECASKLSIGGKCSNNTQCIGSEGLFCSNYTQSLGQCDCDKNNFWNSTCITKQYYNTSCTSSYVCDDNRGLQCQGLGGIMFQKCDCYNSSFIWDSLYIPRQYTCILKLGYNATTCYGNLECQNYNYLVCLNGTSTCLCATTDYWDGSRCQPKRNYTDPCNGTYQCRDYSPVDLVCIYGTTVPPALQCLCNATSFWDQCQQACITTKKRQQPCTLTQNCSSNECDQTANLQCINDSVSNVTGSGWCNCTSLQWWNGTYCRNKGTPSWGVNSSAVCNATYQCADYNLVSCPLGGNSLATCECATTKYWNGLTCLDRGYSGASCMAWTTAPVNTTTCLSAAGAGLLCNYTNGCAGGVCTGGICYCPSGTSWNAAFLICAVITG